MTQHEPSTQDLDDARAWYVQAFGVLPPAPPGAGDDLRIVSLARLLAKRRGTLMDLCDMQTRALLAAEPIVRWEDDRGGSVPAYYAMQQVDVALTASGLPTQALRDKMRTELAAKDGR